MGYESHRDPWVAGVLWHGEHRLCTALFSVEVNCADDASKSGSAVVVKATIHVDPPHVTAVTDLLRARSPDVRLTFGEITGTAIPLTDEHMRWRVSGPVLESDR
jgi:hypothetical protein